MLATSDNFNDFDMAFPAIERGFRRLTNTLARLGLK